MVLTDFADTAGLMTHLDGVVSIDTSVAHLAGVLHRPTALLLGVESDWRWGLESDSTPWYPTMRLFRQRTPGDWGPVLAALSTAFSGGDPQG